MGCNKLISIGLLLWYLAVSVWMAQAPVDPQFWLLASILPALFVVLLIVTHRYLPLSHTSHVLITAFLTLHTIGVHYTYAEVPIGVWMDQVLHLGRNHFDRGLTAPEVAEVTGLKVEAVKSRLHRARTALREQLAPLLGLQHEHEPGSPACPDVFTALERHLDQELSPETCAQIERHLGDCQRCRGVCDSLKRTLRLCQAAPAPDVPGDLQQAVRTGIRRLLEERR